MATKNKESTRYFSDRQEKSICKALGATQNANSGATPFNKGDCVIREASMLIEAKCCMKPKDSVSVKKEWIEKNAKEGLLTRHRNNAVCINFEPDGNNYYIINERLMKILIKGLIDEENS